MSVRRNFIAAFSCVNTLWYMTLKAHMNVHNVVPASIAEETWPSTWRDTWRSESSSAKWTSFFLSQREQLQSITIFHALPTYFFSFQFSSQICKESFKTLSEVVQHRREHTQQEHVRHIKGKGDFTCTECQELFSSSNELDSHLKTHSDTKYECEVIINENPIIKYCIIGFYCDNGFNTSSFCDRFATSSFLTVEL